MGMFDYLEIVDYPLPDNIKRKSYQTKDLQCALDLYQIRADGSLWREDYDIEDHSDPNAEGIYKIFGMMTRVNKHWVRESFSGEIVFYDLSEDLDPHWVEFKAFLYGGKVLRIERIQDREDLWKKNNA